MFQDLSLKVGIAFSKLRLSPNHWTIISILPAILGAYHLSFGDFLGAGILFIFSAFIDLVDGSVARVTGRTSLFGAYLDTIVDRYVEFIMVLGLLLVSLPGYILPASAWIVIYLFGSMMTTYSKSAAKEKGLVKRKLKGGLLERAERLIILVAGIFLGLFDPLYLTYTLILLAILTNVSALQRISAAHSRVNE